MPRQVVIDHQVGPLEVDALARGIRCEQHLPCHRVDGTFGACTFSAFCSILCCSEKTALEVQAGAARSTDRGETRGMSPIC